MNPTYRRKGKILVVDDETPFRQMCQDILTEVGYQAEGEGSAKAGLDRLEREPFDLVLIDLVMPEMDGLNFLGELLKRSYTIPKIMMSAHASVKVAVEAMQLGAADFLSKPFENEELLIRIEKSLRLRERDLHYEHLKKEFEDRNSLHNIVGQSPLMQKVFSTIETVAPTDSTVLIRGETGTGKELVARAIHGMSSRKDKPFITINCSALPETLLESELFGHERGAFTGASNRRLGRFELAEGGTIFLDEIGDVTPPVQVKLLRVLQERVFERLGSSQEIGTNVRILSATNRDLEGMTEDETIRKDFYFRINVVPIHIPPLRDRREDILPLARHFLRKYKKEAGKPANLDFTSEALESLLDYGWAGNVRELENLIERSVVLATGELIKHLDLPANPLSVDADGDGGALPDLSIPFKQYVAARAAELERVYLAACLRRYKGSIKDCAEAAKLNRRSLFEKMRQHGLRKEDFKEKK